MKDSTGLQFSRPSGWQFTGSAAWWARDPSVRGAEQHTQVAVLHLIKILAI
jgi:hypothetical protein